jgi:hypothetical protein
MLALLLTAGAAVAQEPPTQITGGSFRLEAIFDAPEDVDTYTVKLEAGTDQAVGGLYECGFAEATVRGPRGNVLKTFSFHDDFSTGSEFRVAVTGWHTVEVRPVESIFCSWDNDPYPQLYWVALEGDCKASPKTKCVLRVGETKTSRVTYAVEDTDFFKLQGLTAGRYYRVTVSDVSLARLDVQKADGTVLATSAYTVPYTPNTVLFKATSATLFVVAKPQDETVARSYRISLKSE